jgi:hypothetical protein
MRGRQKLEKKKSADTLMHRLGDPLRRSERPQEGPNIRRPLRRPCSLLLQELGNRKSERFEAAKMRLGSH